MTAPLRAVLWDMDGTLVDTEPSWQRAELELVESFGGHWSHELSLELIGQGLWHTARVMRAHGVELSEREIIDRLTARVLEQVSASMPWQPGARELLAELSEAGIRMALVTMSFRPLAEHVARAIGTDAFDVVVTGDDVEHAKPHPEPYLRAAELLGVAAPDCLAFEDSEPGLASATAAGAVTVGVPHIVPLPENPAYVLWPSLAGRTVADVREVFGALR